MQLVKTMIRPLPDDHFPVHFLVRIPQSVCRKRQDATKEAFLQYGRHMVPIIYQVCDGDIIEISQSVARFLHLPAESVPIHTGFNEKLNRLVIGPIFAVLTDRAHDGENPFGSLTPFYEELARYCRQNHLVFYVFSVEDVEGNSIVGYRWEKQRWHQKRCPLPDVVYNRIPTRRRETDEAIQSFFSHCRMRAIPYFNERFLSKWEVYLLLQNSDTLAPSLPETVLYRRTSDIEAMIQKHDHLFFKPIHGSLGKRIIQLRNDGDTYAIRCSTATSEKEQTVSTTTLLSALKIISARMTKNEYIIQQGIETVTYDGKPLDFRILCNKDASGKWKITSVVARLSAEQQFVSNLAQGGLILPLKEALAICFSRDGSHDTKRILMEHSLAYAETVDRETKGIYGEFGIDLAIDNDGKPWLLEINTKPSKSDGTTRSHPFIRPSAKAIVNFALSLSGFQPESEGEMNG